MKDIVKAYDNLPWIVKLILALPFIDGLAWGIYRLAKGIHKNDVVLIIAGIVWLLAGWALLWILDLVTVIIHGKPTILA